MSRESAMAAASPSIPESVPPSAIPEGTPVPSQPEVPKALPSTAFSQMAKKEAEIVKQRLELKKQQEAMAAEKEVLMQAKTKLDEYTTTKQKDPVAALKMLGFTETDIVNYLAAEQPEELTVEQRAEKAAQAAIEARVKAFEETQTHQLKEQKKAENQRFIQTYKADVTKILKGDPDQFECCNHFGASAEEQIYMNAVVNAKQGEVVSPLELAQELENYYEEEYKAMQRLKKFQPTQVPSAEVNPSEPAKSRTVTPGFPNEPQLNPILSRSKTLHSAATATMASAGRTRSETREQKRDRLIAMLQK